MVYSDFVSVGQPLTYQYLFLIPREVKCNVPNSGPSTGQCISRVSLGLFLDLKL